MLYQLGKENMVEYTLSWMSMGSVAHIQKDKKKLAKKVNRFAHLGVCFLGMDDGGLVVKTG